MQPARCQRCRTRLLQQTGIPRAGGLDPLQDPDLLPRPVHRVHDVLTIAGQRCAHAWIHRCDMAADREGRAVSARAPFNMSMAARTGGLRWIVYSVFPLRDHTYGPPSHSPASGSACRPAGTTSTYSEHRTQLSIPPWETTTGRDELTEPRSIGGSPLPGRTFESLSELPITRVMAIHFPSGDHAARPRNRRHPMSRAQERRRIQMR